MLKHNDKRDIIVLKHCNHSLLQFKLNLTEQYIEEKLMPVNIVEEGKAILDFLLKDYYLLVSDTGFKLRIFDMKNEFNIIHQLYFESKIGLFFRFASNVVPFKIYKLSWRIWIFGSFVRK